MLTSFKCRARSRADDAMVVKMYDWPLLFSTYAACFVLMSLAGWKISNVLAKCNSSWKKQVDRVCCSPDNNITLDVDTVLVRAVCYCTKPAQSCHTVGVSVNNGQCQKCGDICS